MDNELTFYWTLVISANVRPLAEERPRRPQTLSCRCVQLGSRGSILPASYCYFSTFLHQHWSTLLLLLALHLFPWVWSQLRAHYWRRHCNRPCSLHLQPLCLKAANWQLSKQAGSAITCFLISLASWRRSLQVWGGPKVPLVSPSACLTMPFNYKITFQNHFLSLHVFFKVTTTKFFECFSV